ncbi:unnamed protein product, partial [Ectocarpus sp. 8 AP-2014]
MYSVLDTITRDSPLTHGYRQNYSIHFSRTELRTQQTARQALLLSTIQRKARRVGVPRNDPVRCSAKAIAPIRCNPTPTPKTTPIGRQPLAEMGSVHEDFLRPLAASFCSPQCMPQSTAPTTASAMRPWHGTAIILIPNAHSPTYRTKTDTRAIDAAAPNT